ncbi:MAG TPA: aspartate kinase [Burkholderiales bacterium]|nr:aspartate kinase [Burkholderiales bacterium]
MWVVKLGGSLASDPALLQRWLETLARDGAGKVVIVPGGGPFADLVRESQSRLRFSDSTAHRMAILAMEQFGLTLAALSPGITPAESEDRIRESLQQGRVPIWLPGTMTLGNPEIPENWDVTSDSLAAWLARRLDADKLILVKSCPVPEGRVSTTELRRLGIVDAAFPDFMRDAGFPALALSSQVHEGFRATLATML